MLFASISDKITYATCHGIASKRRRTRCLKA